MKQLNEEILNQSFGMENDSIYELTIRLSGYEKVIMAKAGISLSIFKVCSKVIAR